MSDPEPIKIIVLTYRGACKVTNSPKKEVGRKVCGSLHRVFPAVDVPNVHKDYLIRRRCHEEPLDTSIDGVFIC